MSNDNDTARSERADGTGASEQVAPSIRKSIEVWESEKGIPTWLRSATRTLHRFPRGRELLEHEFDEAVRAAAQLSLR